jgi:type VI secretion system protein ImpG
MRINNEEFLRYYWEELLYLRRLGQGFARSYPKIAGRLELQGDECPDPHVERLIESFAFLTARIQRDLDSDFPEIAAELLDVLYPHYLRTVPSMAIARFEVDAEGGKLTSGYTIPRHTKLFAVAGDGAICRWRTAYPVTLWPIEIAEASVRTTNELAFLDRVTDVGAVLRVRLVSRAEPLETLALDRLRLHLNGDPIFIDRLYTLLLNDTRRIAVLPEGADAPSMLPAGSVAAAGFDDDEALLPQPPGAHPAYRVVQEYFAFPQKYQFVDVGNLAGKLRGKQTDLLFLLGTMPRARLNIGPESIVLGCTPVVNLFEKTSEPLRVDHRRLEYRLVADARNEKTTEIHSILRVSSSVNPADPSAREYAPFYDWSHALARNVQRTFWHERRELSLSDGIAGTETFLSFVDLDFKPAQPPAETIWAHTLSSNRALASELPAGALLQTDHAAVRISCLAKPTAPIPPPLGGQMLWRLVSHLSLNYLSLSDTTESLKALQDILRLYSVRDERHVEQQIAGLQSLSVRRIVRQLGEAMLRGFARGTEITLTVDEAAFVGGSAFLFISVLNRFFSLYASTNSFTQLIVRSNQRQGVWKQWPPTVGGRVVL